MVNDLVVAQHAEEAAFLWTMRDRAIAEPHYALKDLATIDERVEAHLDGLSTAGRRGWELCKANLEHIGPGSVFALGVLAFRSGDRTCMRDALFASCASSELPSGLVSALGWLDPEQAMPWMEMLLRASTPEHQQIGIAAHAVHRRDPGPALTAAARHSHPGLRARALRAIGELRRGDLTDELRRRLRDADPECRFWSAWSLSLMGETDGIATLKESVERQDDRKLVALDVVLRAMQPRQARHWVKALANEPALDRLAVVAAGIVGDPASVGWLIHKMEVPATARLAGEAFSLITGVNLALHDLVGEPADGPEDEPWSTYEANLPTPAPALVSAWWRKNGGELVSGGRYLCGRPVGREAVMQVLVHGMQRQRRAAAIEWACQDPRAPLYEVRARAQRQQRHAAAWTS